MSSTLFPIVQFLFLLVIAAAVTDHYAMKPAALYSTPSCSILLKSIIFHRTIMPYRIPFYSIPLHLVLSYPSPIN